MSKITFAEKSDYLDQMMAVQIIFCFAYFRIQNLNIEKINLPEFFCTKMLALNYCLLFEVPKIQKFWKIWMWIKINNIY